MERVGVVLRDLGEGSAVSRRLAEAEALARWGDVVGRELASRTVPINVSGGRLLVVVRGSALRQELSYQKVTILRRFNTMAGRRVAREIVLLEGDPARAREQLESCEPLAPLAARERQAEPVVAAVSDEENGEERCLDEGTSSECGLAYQPLDALAYRRSLTGIARGTDAGETE